MLANTFGLLYIELIRVPWTSTDNLEKPSVNLPRKDKTGVLISRVEIKSTLISPDRAALPSNTTATQRPGCDPVPLASINSKSAIQNAARTGRNSYSANFVETA